jgi:glycerate 2-kinase
LRAVDPARLVSAALSRSPFQDEATVRVIAVGKASGPMAAAALRTLGARVRGGIVIAPAPVDLPPLTPLVGGHPVPDSRSEIAGRSALAAARAAGRDELLLVLISGGASAMMAVPADGLRLEDKRETTTTLLAAGADIQALNIVRKHLSAVKGGRLAVAAAAHVAALAISDVIGDDLSAIGSGPTVPDASTFADALGVLRRFGGEAAFPHRVVSHLRRGMDGELPETPKPGDPRLERSTALVIGGRRDAMLAAFHAAEDMRYRSQVIDEPVIGEAREAARAYLHRIKSMSDRLGRPLCIISSGETTVHVKGAGRGGRNQEFALALADDLAAIPNAVVGSIGTDGVDGPTDAAGAVVDSTTAARAAQAGIGPSADYLLRNDAYSFFASVGGLIQTGLTGTNVGDLQIALLA